MRKWLRYILPFATLIIALMISAVIFLIEEEPADCACMPDPQVRLTTPEAEYMIAATLPAQAQEVNISAMGSDYSATKSAYQETEVYVSFALSPVDTATFLTTLSNLAPMQPNYNPFIERDTYISNFGTINGTPAIFEGSTYRFPLCDHAIMVDKSDSDLFHLYIYARCEG